MSKQVVLGKVKGERGESGFSPIVDFSKEDGVLNISVTDVEGTKTESIVTGENVQGDFLETDTSKGSYIWNKPTIPSKVSELENDLNYQMVNTTYRLDKSGNSIILTGSDGTSTSVLDADTDTTYGSADANNDGLMTKEFVQKLNSIAEGAQVNSITGIKGDNETSYRTGQVNITPENIGAEKEGVVNTVISEHNVSTSSHNDIRVLITELTNRFNALADSDDTTLDQMSELVAYVKSNKNLIDSITTNKINISDIVDNLTTNISSKVLSASQGVAIKSLIDALELVVNDKVDSSALSSHTSNTTSHTTSTEKTNWNFAKSHADSSHAPSDAEKNIIIGIRKNGVDLSVDTSRKVNITIPTKVSELTNDSGFKTTDNNTTYTLTKDGSTITLTGSDGNSTSVSDNNTTYNNATTVSNGLMSSTDKLKLDNIAEGANAYVLPIASTTLGGVRTTSTVTTEDGYEACPIINGIPFYKEASGGEIYATSEPSGQAVGEHWIKEYT